MAMEAASGRSLDRFFDRWFYASTLPSVALRYHAEMKDGARALALRFDQTGDVFDLPVTVVLTFADHAPETVTIPITARTVERDIPLSGTLRTVDISKDDGTLADIVVTRSGR
jgi:aminopeptidase N